MLIRLSSGSELIANLRFDYEEGCWPTLHNLVESWSYSFDESEVKRTSQHKDMKL